MFDAYICSIILQQMNVRETGRWLARSFLSLFLYMADTFADLQSLGRLPVSNVFLNIDSKIGVISEEASFRILAGHSKHLQRTVPRKNVACNQD